MGKHSATATLERYEHAQDQTAARHAVIPREDLRGLSHLPADHQAMVRADADRGQLAPAHYNELYRQRQQEMADSRAQAERRGRLRRAVRRGIAAVALTGAAAGAVFGITRAYQAHEAGDAANFKASQASISKPIKTEMVAMNEKALHDSTAQASSLNFLTQTENLDGQQVVHITEVNVNDLGATEEAVMGMTNGHADPTKVFYDKVGSLEGGDTTGSEVGGDTTVFVAPGGEKYTTGDPFLGTVEGWAAYHNDVVTTVNDPSAAVNGASIYDTTDPSQSAGFGEPTPTPLQITQDVITGFHSETNG